METCSAISHRSESTAAPAGRRRRKKQVAVRLKHLWKTYPGGANPAVKDLSLEIRDGEIFTLLGPSGCGKTTTLRMVAGLETARRRRDLFRRPGGGRSARAGSSLPPNKRNVGMVFQSYAIWPHMTVVENVAFPLKARRFPANEIKERVAARARSGRPGRIRRSARAAAQRRPAAARRLRARARHRAASAAAGRAVQQPRRQAARADARRA